MKVNMNKTKVMIVVVPKDCQAHNLNKEDAMDRSRWKKLIKIG